MVGTADGQRERIGCIFRFWWMGKAQERLNHFLNLEFACPAMPYDGEFGLFGGEFVDRDRFAGSGEVDHPFGHAEFDGALDIFKDELGLDGYGDGLEPFDERLDAVKKDFVPIGKD